jgi:GAF domain-containing protein
MRQLVRLLRSLTRIRRIYANAFEQHQARSLAWMASTITIVSLLYLPSLAFNGMSAQQNLLFVVSIVVVVAGMGLVLFLIDRGSLLGASVAYIALLYMAALAIVLRYILTPSSANLMALSVPLVAAGVLLNRRGIAAMAGLILLTMFSMRLVGIFGLPTNVVLVPPTATEETWLNLIFLTADALMLGVFTGGQRTLLQQNLILARDLRSSTTISRALAGLDALDDVLRRAMDMVRDQFGYYYVQIFLAEEMSGLLVLWGGTSIAYSQDETSRRITPDDPSVINEVVRTQKTMRLTLDDPAERRSEFLSATRTQLLIPLTRGNNVLGVLDVHSVDADGFSEHEIEILEALAAQLAASMETAQIYDLLEEAVRERAEIETQLRDATRDVELLSREASGRGWNRFLQTRGASRAGFDWRGGVLTPNSTLTPSLESALSSAMPEILVEDGEQILTVPIVLRGQMLGAMEFRAPGDRAWNNRSLELARIIAQRLALALDNIRLYEQAQTIANREQTANQVAAHLQSKTDIDALLATAAEAFQQALGATRTTIRLGAPGQASGTNGDRT